jgi:mannitol/fructose-specific phosphotransferase system IIA component (Ntr-type)
MKLQDILQKNAILVALEAADKIDLITRMGKYLCSLYDIPNADFIIKKVLERETQISTGIGFGIAVPHARIQGIDRPYMVAARTAVDLEFNAIDELPVNLVFLLISPANTSTEHTNILSALSRIMAYEEVRSGLTEAKTAEQFLEIIVQSEEKYVQ